ncbi:hypothetical protein [Plantactinospora sp. KLBMP9567]|uniref:hypothetical protein n=1 Tax=Plantactinospora sp. KLBMP9567 TaxID=3085900 RepID=UPI00298240C1|nr:hypothetical protein [Plantactinospora sp. KLBMP9567]MDW5328874.1 hypothetical protein [Plantactinospora sp. KLBMP9567]
MSCIEWEPAYAADQLAQSRALAELATDPRLDGDLPVLLIGDLNAAVDQPDLTPLLDVMVDAWAAGGGDPDAATLSSAVPDVPQKATKGNESMGCSSVWRRIVGPVAVLLL